MSAFGQGAFPPGTSLPPRGYILPPPTGAVRSTPPQQPQYRPAPAPSNPSVARYPRPESTEAPKKKVATAPSPAPKKKVEVASTKSTKGATAGKTTKSDPKATASSKTSAKKPTATKPVVASTTTRKKESVSDKTAKVKESIAEAKTAVKSLKEEAKVNLGESARDLHAPAKNSAGQASTVAAATTKQPTLKSADAALLAPPPPTNVSAQVPTITVNANPTESANMAASVNVPSVITQAEKLPSRVISSGMMPLAMPPSAPITPPTPAVAVASTETESLKEAVTAPPKAHTLNPLPIEEFPADDEDTTRASKLLANSGASTAPAEKPKATVKEPAKPAVVETPREPVKVVVAETRVSAPTPTPVAEEEPATPPAKPTLALPPMVKPSMNSVRTASFKPNAPTASAPVIDSGSDFTPGGATFDEPPKPKTAPSVTLSPSLGTMTIDAERADSENSKNLVTFNGNVRIDCKRFQMKADKVVSHLRQPDVGGGVEKVVSDGNVTVKMLGTDGPGYVASGSHAIYDPIKETILLTGWPKIEEGNKALVASSAATEILIDTKTSRLTTNGSTKTVIRQ